MNNIQSEFFKFILDGKPDKIKRSVMYQDYKNGGLINLNWFVTALKAGCLRCIVDENNKRIMERILSK